jgi:hypothetical protein
MPLFYLKSLFQSVDSDPEKVSDSGKKGKGRGSGIVGLSPDLARRSDFRLPSLEIACFETAESWPKRILPNSEPLPPPFNRVSQDSLMLSTVGDGEIGELFFELVKWTIAPPPIDLTVEETGGEFRCPNNTEFSFRSNGIWVPNGRWKLNLLSLITSDSLYSM